MFLLWSVHASAQQPDVRPYETEEDLWEALREGEIAFDDYLELLDLHRTGTGSLSAPASDWELLPGSEAGYLSPADSSNPLTQNIATPKARTGSLRWSWRTGYDGHLSSSADGDGYWRCGVGSRRFGLGRERWRALVHWRQVRGAIRWQRRVVAIRTPGLSVQAGSIEPRWGRGLVIGRRSRVIRTSDTKGDVLQPRLSRFNGLWVSGNLYRGVRGDVLISDIRSDRIRERMTGVQITALRDDWAIGVNVLNGTLARRDTVGLFQQRAVGGHLQLGKDAHRLIAEIAMTGNGATAKAAEMFWRFNGGRFHGTAWTYAREFTNPWGGGPAHSDGTMIRLEEIDERYLSRTAGERGFALSTRIGPRVAGNSRLKAGWDWMTHREDRHAPLKHTWTVRLNWEHPDFVLRPFVRGDSEQGKLTRQALGFFGRTGDAGRRVSARLEVGRHRTHSDRFLRTGGDIRMRLNQTVQLEPSFRWIDPDLDRRADGYWYFYFREVIFPASAWRIETTLVWQRYENRSREDVVELRIRMTAGG